LFRQKVSRMTPENQWLRDERAAIQQRLSALEGT
jgi:hypothetical protein